MTEYVYIFRRSDGLRKLGHTKDVRRRLRELNDTSGINHEIERTWPFPERAHAIEGCAHYELKARKVKGLKSIELYDLSLECLVAAVERAVEYVSSIYARLYQSQAARD